MAPFVLTLTLFFTAGGALAALQSDGVAESLDEELAAAVGFAVAGSARSSSDEELS